ncbi:putative acyl--CoA ligase YhfT [compost metagenome]
MKEGYPFDQNKIKKYCNDNLSAYKVPRKWICVQSIPKTKTGKIDRTKSKNLYQAMSENEMNITL